jgi:hypothetical protein
VLVSTGYWPPQIPFEGRDLATVVTILNEQARKQR